MATLQRKAKESGDMLTMLRDQLPPPEPVTERITYAAYVKSVLLGLSLKDFRWARKGINKVLKPSRIQLTTTVRPGPIDPPPDSTRFSHVSLVTRPRRNTPRARSRVRARTSASHSMEVGSHLPVSGDHHRPKPFRCSTPRTLPTCP
ncbi:uncharacterized protein [Haliotis cracherodii]|uniref:uncharacterized protein n=1 Tax=Haliotis cracherodii TaxID=6455 RepID=UPI0039E7D8AF